jgi:hypothetical protein
MVRQTGVDFESQVVDTIKQLNYKVTMQPSPKSDRTAWFGRIASWFTEPTNPESVPDMMVTSCGKSVLVEAKAYPILLGPVIQARYFSDYFGAPSIICVPDDAFPDIPRSVAEWAETNGIVVSPLGKMDETLEMLLANA